MSNPEEQKKIVEEIHARHAKRRAGILEELKKDSGGWPESELRGVIDNRWCDEMDEVARAEIQQAKLEQ